MNLKELEALEAKTVRIVEALEAIEGEQRSCEEQAEVIDSHYGTLSELVERIDGVAKELQKVLSLLQRTDFGRTLKSRARSAPWRWLHRKRCVPRTPSTSDPAVWNRVSSGCKLSATPWRPAMRCSPPHLSRSRSL